MSPNFELIAQMLGDYYDLQADGIVDAANCFPLSAIEEQITQLGSLQLVSNTTLANRIAELEREVSMHRNAEITWEKTMMQAVGEDGPSDVIKAIDKIKAERDTFADRLEDAENQYSELHNVNSALAAQVHVLNTAAGYILNARKPLTKRKAYAALAGAVNKTPQHHLRERDAASGRAGFVAAYMQSGYSSREFVEAMYGEEADEYAESIRQGGSA